MESTSRTHNIMADIKLESIVPRDSQAGDNMVGFDTYGTHIRINREEVYELTGDDLTANTAVKGIVSAQQLSSISGGGPSIGNNLLINGDFSIYQRGDVLSKGSYSADRWLITGSTYVQMGVSRVITNSGGDSLRLTSNATYNAGILDAQQILENFKHLAGKVVTYSAKVKATTSYARLRLRLSPSLVVSSSKHSGNGEWELLSVTGVVGSDVQQLIAHATILVDTPAALNSGQYLEIKEAKLEVGEVATKFQYPDPTIELLKCQRYFQTYGGQTAYERVAIGFTSSTGAVRFPLQAFTDMRVPPTLEVVGVWALEGTYGIKVIPTLTLDQASTKVLAMNALDVNGLNGGDCQQLIANGSLGARLNFDAEIYI